MAYSLDERSKILVLSYNAGIVAVIRSGRSRSSNTNLTMKRIYNLCAVHCICLHVEYVPSRDNISEALSRGNIPALPGGFPTASSRSDMHLPTYLHDQRLFLWKGVNTLPPSTVAIPLLERLAKLAAWYSLRDTGSYGLGIRKFHVFCDIFSVPEGDRLPAAFPSFIHLRFGQSQIPSKLSNVEDVPFEPVAPSTARKYLAAAICARHIAQS